MKKIINKTSLLSFLFLLGIGGFFSYIHTQSLYTDYRNHWDYRRLKPDIIPSSQMLQSLAVGHDTTYGDILWMQLIQFIGDNIRDSRYLDFTHEILTRIHALHPRFARAYEVDILFLPSTSYRDTDDILDKKRSKIEDGVQYYEDILPKICDQNKIDQIDRLPFGVELWEREDLHNPCISGYIPYYLAGKYDTELSDRMSASRYYKIASMHDDAPRASRYLGIISYSSDGNYRDGGLTFALMATEAYDEDPYACQNLALRIATDISSGKELSDEWIDLIEKEETKITPPKDTSNPLVLSSSTCLDQLQRGLKQIYLGYITEKSKRYPDLTTGDELIDLGILSHIPTIQSQSGYTVIKQKNIWRYRQVFE